jgi:hypothetical protein
MGSSASKVQPNVPRNAANSRAANSRATNVSAPVNPNVAARVYSNSTPVNESISMDPVNPSTSNNNMRKFYDNIARQAGGRRKTRSRKNKKSRKSKK